MHVGPRATLCGFIVYHYPSRNMINHQTGDFITWSAVVSAANMPWLTPRMTALIIKAEINGIGTINLISSFDFFISQGNGWYKLLLWGL